MTSRKLCIILEVVPDTVADRTLTQLIQQATSAESLNKAVTDVLREDFDSAGISDVKVLSVAIVDTIPTLKRN